MPPFVHFFINLHWLQTLRALRDDDLCATFVQIVDDPIAVESFVREHRTELDTPDQRRNPNRVVAIGGYQNEPNQVAKRIDERKNFGRPAAL